MSQTLAQKLLGVQERIGAVTKSSSNPHFRSKYADLNEVLDVAKEALNGQGIFITQSPGANEFGKYLETSLVNADDGQQISGRVFFSGAEENMQKIGAAITYARRFGLVSLLALESEDDDGETASGRGMAIVPQTVKSKSVPKGTDGNGKDSVSSPNPKVTAPVQAEIPKATNREKTNQKIALTSKVLKDAKKATHEDIASIFNTFGVDSVVSLTDAQAEEFLKQLTEKLNK